MRNTVVYKITRKDGMEYVGITVNPKHRFSQHKKSNRFSIGIEKIEILAECDDYEKAEDLEEHFISLYDTYRNGLNLTVTGKGKSECKFNTLGHRYSEESKKKMSESAKKRGVNNRGYKHSEETKKHWSEKRKGNFFGKRKISPDDAMKIYDSFSKDNVVFDTDFIKRFVKKNQQEMVESLEFSELKSPNGKPLSKETLYTHYYSEVYGVTNQSIRKILNSKGRTAPDYEV